MGLQFSWSTTLLGYVDIYKLLTSTQELMYYSFWRGAQEIASLGKEPKIPYVDMETDSFQVIWEMWHKCEYTGLETTTPRP
jgi:hypothetical protein